MQTVATILSQRDQPQAQPAALADDGELTQDSVRKMVEESYRSGVAPVVQQYYQSQTEANRRLFRKEYADFAKYEGEIVQMLAQQGPQLAAMPQAWEAAYKAVKALHADEEVEERVKARLAEQKAKRAEEDDGEEDEEEGQGREGLQVDGSTEPPQPPQATATVRPEAPAATAGVPSGGRPQKRVALDREQNRIATVFGLSADDYLKAASPAYSEDIFGFRDAKTGKVRSRV
jgi:pyruvate/2-oxoglutarate dehydrogenase complex dihydrolipoamide acyltransferase (E2) component